MSTVLLFPKRGGTGGEDKAAPSAFPSHLKGKMLKNGWSEVPDVTKPDVAKSLIEKAQAETAKEREAMQAEMAELKKLKAELEAMKEDIVTKKSKKGAEV